MSVCLTLKSQDGYIDNMIHVCQAYVTNYEFFNKSGWPTPGKLTEAWKRYISEPFFIELYSLHSNGETEQLERLINQKLANTLMIKASLQHREFYLDSDTLKGNFGGDSVAVTEIQTSSNIDTDQVNEFKRVMIELKYVMY